LLKVLQGMLAFALELGALAALGYWGWHTGSGVVLEWVLGLSAPAAMIVIWALFLAADGTKARIGLPYGLVIALKLAVFGAAAVALSTVGASALALVLAGLAVFSVGADAVRPLQR
jgi:hypothetical protein